MGVRGWVRTWVCVSFVRPTVRPFHSAQLVNACTHAPACLSHCPFPLLSRSPLVCLPFSRSTLCRWVGRWLSCVRGRARYYSKLRGVREKKTKTGGHARTHARTESWKRLASHWYPSVVVFARVAVILQIFPLFLYCEKQSVKVDPILVVVYACLPEFATTIVLEKA